MSELQDVSASSHEIQQAAYESVDFLAALAMPTVYTFKFPPQVLSLWEMLRGYTAKKRDFSKLAIGWPRGFSKTTLIKLYILYVILYTDKQFILIVGSTAKMAANIIADIIDMLEEPNIKNVFGDWKIGAEKDTEYLKKFGFRGRNIVIAGLGAEGSLRGFNLKNQRPDVIIFEDAQTAECAASPQQSATFKRWMYGTAMKAKSHLGCLTIFVGNMYVEDGSILKQLKKSRSWIKFITGGILSDGTSLWEELKPIEDLKAEFQADLDAGVPEIFYAEVLNDDEAVRNNLINLSAIPAYPYEDDDIPTARFVIIDPATDKPGADAVSVGYFEYHNAPVLRHVTEGRLSPGDTIRAALNYCFLTGCSLVAVEGVAYQSTFKYWFDVITLQLGITGIECVEVYPGGSSKNSRIADMLRSYAKQDILVHPDARPAAHTQMALFNMLKRDNVDGVLDLLCYAPKVLELYGEYCIATNTITTQDFHTIEQAHEIECSPF